MRIVMNRLQIHIVANHAAVSPQQYPQFLRALRRQLFQLQRFCGNLRLAQSLEGPPFETAIGPVRRMKQKAARFPRDNPGVVVAAFDDVSLSHVFPHAENGASNCRMLFASRKAKQTSATSQEGRRTADHFFASQGSKEQGETQNRIEIISKSDRFSIY
jgi:hypothetical protein